jgi:transcriptional regulator with XRE-family HTH domain
MRRTPKRSPFGDWLYQWRRARKLTQAELATAAGCSDSIISAYETGKKKEKSQEFVDPEPELVEALATALRRPVQEARILAGYNPSPVPVTLREVESGITVEKWTNGEFVPVEMTTDKAKQIQELREQARKLMEQIDKLTA